LKRKLQGVVDHVANTFAVNGFAGGEAGEPSNSLLAPETARIGLTRTQYACARDPRVYQTKSKKPS
jgi:hypothetical protein